MIGKDCFLGICLASSKHFLSQKKKNLKADDLKSVILFSSKTRILSGFLDEGTVLQGLEG